MPPEGSGVHFQDQGEEFGHPPTESGTDLTGKLVSWGLVSSRQEAQYVMIGVAVFAFIIAVFFFGRAVAGGDAPPPPPPNLAPQNIY